MATPHLTSRDHPTIVTMLFVRWAHSAITWSDEGEQQAFQLDLEWVSKALPWPSKKALSLCTGVVCGVAGIDFIKYDPQEKTKEYKLWRHSWKNSYLSLIINSLCWHAGYHHKRNACRLQYNQAFIYIYVTRRTLYLMILKDVWTLLHLILKHWSIIYKRPLAKLYYSHEGLW